jgi:RNA polymerase sigma factor (TIGR02999 family)
MDDDDDDAITRWLSAAAGGDAQALDRLIPLVYDELRGLARSQLRQRGTAATLSTTALVHEAYERLARQSRLAVSDRRHFFVLCARVMRQIVIDNLRRRHAGKRGGGVAALGEEILGAEPVAAEQASMLALEEALRGLGAHDPGLLETASLVWFAGLDPAEVASLAGVSVRTVQRDLARARAWVADALELPP